MALLLGIDTGGTFTDAVILRDGEGTDVLASAKSLTTRHDLSLGIAGAIDAVLAAGDIDAADISLVSVSTTLATNALVEGQGSPVALVFAGFDPADAGRAGLMQALDGDPLILIGGGHDTAGIEIQPPDLEALDTQLEALPAQTRAFAVVSRFASRNAGHERQIRDHLRTRTGLPVTCGHELSAKLNGPLRAVTTVLNARLIGLISALIEAVERALSERTIAAPLMLVRGDGALVSAAFAKMRPIETILSGPAASLVGAAALTGQTDAVIADIGGTTTDIAVLQEGAPRLSSEGAQVGDHKTMVEAVEMRAIGLGGDSALTIDDSGLTVRYHLGPRRVIPISLLALDHGEVVRETLSKELEAGRPGPDAARFAIRVSGVIAEGLSGPEASVLELVGDGPLPVSDLAANRRLVPALERLARSGHVRLSGFTPSDAAHVLGLHDAWNSEAALMAAEVLSLRRDGRGQRIATDGATLARAVIDQLVGQSVDAVLSTALARDGIDLAAPSSDALVRGSRRDKLTATRIDIGLALPLIGLGASAGVYYPHVAAHLGTAAILPDLAPVANAVGAVSGKVAIRRTVSITETAEGMFRVLHESAQAPFPSYQEAEAAAQGLISTIATKAAQEAGADDPVVAMTSERRSATVENRETLIEAIVTATASGRPRLK